MRKLAFIIGLVSVLAIPVLSPAEAVTGGTGYQSFAKMSSQGPVRQATCREHGGRPVFNDHYDVVMKIGRSDTEMYNVYYYGGHRYVTFRIDSTGSLGRLFGIKSYDKGLCQF